MYNSKRILALVPARGGSKGIKRKNITTLGGRPLIEYTIEAALSSKYIDAVIVSTDLTFTASSDAPTIWNTHNASTIERGM